MALLTLGEAARMCGVPKSTISRAIKSGRLSAGRADDGSYSIDPAELSRAYEFKPEQPAATDSDEGGVVQHATGASGPSNASASPVADPELAIRLAAAEAELKGLRDMVEELRRTRDKWEAQAERLTLALAAPKPELAPQPVAVEVPATGERNGSPSEPAPSRGSWWPFRRAG